MEKGIASSFHRCNVFRVSWLSFSSSVQSNPPKWTWLLTLLSQICHLRMIDVCLVPVGKVAANMIQEIHSRKSSIILTSRDQNSKKQGMEVLHENHLFSVIFALYTGFPRFLCEVFCTKNLWMLWPNMLVLHRECVDGWMNRWVDVLEYIFVSI